jgi:hypothetical protein
MSGGTKIIGAKRIIWFFFFANNTTPHVGSLFEEVMQRTMSSGNHDLRICNYLAPHEGSLVLTDSKSTQCIMSLIVSLRPLLGSDVGWFWSPIEASTTPCHPLCTMRRTGEPAPHTTLDFRCGIGIAATPPEAPSFMRHIGCLAVGRLLSQTRWFPRGEGPALPGSSGDAALPDA